VIIRVRTLSLSKKPEIMLHWHFKTSFLLLDAESYGARGKVVETTNKPARTKPTSHSSGISTLRLVGEKTGARREHLPSGA
jgi:hypothetical protein